VCPRVRVCLRARVVFEFFSACLSLRACVRSVLQARVQLSHFAKVLSAHQVCAHSKVLLFILHNEAVIVLSTMEAKVGTFSHFLFCNAASTAD
jgi:hypothetical protein